MSINQITQHIQQWYKAKFDNNTQGPFALTRLRQGYVGSARTGLAHTIRTSPIIKNFFTYSFGALCLRTITLFLMPIIVHTMSPEEYGVLALINSFVAIVAPIAGLGLRQVLAVEYFHYVGTNRHYLVNEIISIYLLVCTPVFLLLYSMRDSLHYCISTHQCNEQLILLTLAQIFIYFFVELLYQLLGYKYKARELTLVQITVALITISCSLVFVLKLRYGIVGIVAAQCIGSSVAASVGVYCYCVGQYHKFLSVINIKKIIYYLHYGIPFIPGLIFAWLLASGNRWFLVHYATLHDVGIYAITDAIAQLFHLFILTPWSLAYVPSILVQYTQNSDNLIAIEQRNHLFMYGMMISIMVLIACAYVSCTPLFMWVLPTTYHAAITYVWPLLIGYVFLLGSYFASTLIQYHKKKYFLAFAWCVPALLNSVLNWLLVPQYGLYGCTSATLISYVVYFVIVLGYNYRLQRYIVQSQLN